MRADVDVEVIREKNFGKTILGSHAVVHNIEDLKRELSRPDAKVLRITVRLPNTYECVVVTISDEIKAKIVDEL